MNGTPERPAVACAACPLRRCRGLRPLDPVQTDYMQGFKLGELRVERGAQILVQGRRSPHVYTVLEGVVMRYKLLEDGRRQIVNFLFPGDLVGLQAAMGEPLSHGVEALTPATLCQFARDRIPQLIRDHPEWGFDVVWLAAKEEEALDDHLVALGQRNARERVAYLAVFLVKRAMESGFARGTAVGLGLTQTQIADMLGLSLVHTNRTLQALRQANLIRWNLSEIEIPDLAAACDFAAIDPASELARPYL